MIELVTGLPGNGKTLFSIGNVKKMAEEQNRPVFYNGIPEVNIPGWELLEDPREWAKVPPRSIVLLDEGQKTFRNRSVGSTPPPFVTELETHRHLGIDLVIITQHPSLIDPSVRRLAGLHRHLVRIWGMEASTVHRWDAVKDNCDKSRADSEKTKWAFDKKLYGLYKSAEVHTMKRSIPTRVKLLIAVPFLLAAAAYYVSTTLMHKTHPQAPIAPGVVAGSTSTPGQVAAGKAVPFDPVADARQFVAMNTPRVVGLPQTAPKYDQLTQPVRVPIPAACVQVGAVSEHPEKRVVCKCYSQQGTPMDVPLNMCVEFARNGFFQDFDAERDRANVDRAKLAQAVIPDSPESMPGSRVSIMPYTPEPSKIKGIGK